MTLLHRSLLAITIATTIAGCNTDLEPTVPMPNDPTPLEPGPTVVIDTLIDDIHVTALSQPVVITDVEGNEKLTSVESFRGIQFAQQQRFEHSTLKPFTADEIDGSIDATKFEHSCPQEISKTVEKIDEDCLNLNLWRPAGTTADSDLPVYVFIHGGDFEYGSGSEPLIHGDTVVAQGDDDGQGFIYVSFNYRLGLLGTYWTKAQAGSDNGSFSGGNFGLGDQMRALEWVNQNIAKFGGNATNITVMGQGSGAMSVGILQQHMAKNEAVNYHFDRAIMQSNPYGFEYKNDEAAQSHRKKICSEFDGLSNFLGACVNDADEQLKNTSIYSYQDILLAQSELLNPVQKTINWLKASVDFLGAKKASTPMHHLMPFAPYNEVTDENESGLFAGQPATNGLTTPTVLGVNADESDSFGMLPSLTFLLPMVIQEVCKTADIPVICGGSSEEITEADLIVFGDEVQNWASNPDHLDALTSRLSSLSTEDIARTSEELTAYGVVTKLFFGTDNQEGTEMLLDLADFYPESEANLGGAAANMSMFKTALNDLLFTGPARQMVIEATNSNVNQSAESTLYYFDVSPSFNVWGSEDLLSSIGCILSACNGSELPFVMNKAMRFDGTSVSPTAKEKAQMNQLSRLWFSDQLFENFQYISEQEDNVMVIDESIELTPNWDKSNNKGVDTKLRAGRLTGLGELGLLLGYID